MSTKSLKTLIRLAKWSVDERQRVLTTLVAREAEILTCIEGHHKQLEAERDIARGDATGVGHIFGHFLVAWNNHLRDLTKMLSECQAQIAQARDDLAEAYREQKSREQVQALRQRRADEEAARKEQAELDEIGLNQFRQKSGETDA